MTDPITDMLNRIMNGQAASKESVLVPFSNIKYSIAEILKENGYVLAIEKKGRKEKRFIELGLKYDSDENSQGGKRPAILGVKRISKPGKRVYIGYKEIRPVRHGYGIAIVSTPQGVATDRDARKKKSGGEVLCEVW